MRLLALSYFLLCSSLTVITAQDWIAPDGTIDVELKIMDSQVKSSNPENKRILIANILDGIDNKEYSSDSVAVKNILIDLALEPLQKTSSISLVDVRADAIYALARLYSKESESALYTIVKNEKDEYLISLAVALLSQQTKIYNQSLQLFVARRFAPLLYRGNRNSAAMIYINYVEYLASLDGVFIENEVFSTLLTIVDHYRSPEIQQRVIELSKRISNL